ncbi:MAG TPA: glycosyltransferase family 2 protein [bacterium]|nr:glycosyltransferase family 2 protein [bacterium]
MKIIIHTLTYGRERTFDVFAHALHELDEAYPQINFECIVVGTGDKNMVEKYGFEYHEFSNQYLSEKAQFGLDLCKDRADYYLFLGSDDIVRPDTFQYYLDNLCDFIAPMDMVFWYEGHLYYSPGYNEYHPRAGESLGVGRMLSNDLLSKCGWELWPEQKVKNIDYQSFRKIMQHDPERHFFYQTQMEGLICDIKTSENLSEFDPIRFCKVGEPYHYLSKKTVKLLNLVK